MVYGDRERREPAADAFARLAGWLSAVQAIGDVPARRVESAEFAIECGILVQALVDREFEERGSDELSPVAQAGARLCFAAGRAYACGDLTLLTRALAALSRLAPQAELRLREPEGYAFYALYPELYVRAAQTLPPSLGPLQVIGIRSIGTSLAGFVAGALAAERLPLTVRPTGHPFARELRVGPRMAEQLLEHAARTHYLVVDEGPGLSGSSFMAVANWLGARGVGRAQISFFPSHDGEPGAEAAPASREGYREIDRRFVSFERTFEEPALRAWFPETVIGPGPCALRDLSGGRWRELFYGHAPPLPPSHVRDERRKYLLRTEHGSWLMKYVGLGERSRRVLERARVLSEHGFTPELRAAHYGMALFRFHGEATPLPRVRAGRAELVAQLAQYLAFLAQRFRRPERGAGATPDDLLVLAKQNAAELLGPEPAAVIARFAALLHRLRDSHAAIASDNKLDACEWICLPDGRWLKCDAEAHHAAHDCIGCQDPAWDVAGANIELGLREVERESVLRALRDRAGVEIAADKLLFYEIAYAAFRAGSAHFAELALRGSADDDAERWRAEKARYARELAYRLTGLANA